MTNGAATPSQAYSRITSYVAARLAAGWTHVLVFTLADASSNITEADRTSLNSLITGGAVANNYTVVDVGADATMGCNGCAANATYFQDGIHPTSAGNAIIAGLAKTALAGVGLN